MYQSFEELFQTYYSRLCYFSFQIVKDKASAEDIAQDAFVKYWDQQELVARHEIAVKNFLYTTVRNASLNFIRHEKVEKHYLEKQDPLALDEAGILHALIRSEVIDEIYSAIESLPESCRRISRMGYLEGMKNHEIAAQLGLSINTIKTQKQRALQLLRLKLHPEAFMIL